MNRVELVKLTKKQELAFKKFKKAHNECKKSGIRFYTCLETMTAFNGEYINDIHDNSNPYDLNTNDTYNPTIVDAGFSGWTDDTHYIEFKGTV